MSLGPPMADGRTPPGARTAVDAWYAETPGSGVNIREYLHPEVVFDVCAGWPNGGRFVGQRGIFEEFFPEAAKAWETIRPEVDEVLESGDSFVVLGRYVGVALPSRTPFEVAFVHVWATSEGRLVSLRQVADTAILERARRGGS